MPLHALLQQSQYHERIAQLGVLSRWHKGLDAVHKGVAFEQILYLSYHSINVRNR